MGRFQDDVRAEVASLTAPASVAELRWRLWDRKHSASPQLAKHFHQQLTRELRRSVYRCESRGLRNFHELIDVYPFKTLDRHTRDMRQRLLPLLEAFAVRRTRYSREQNELHLLSLDEARVLTHRRRWAAIEPALFSAVRRVADRDWALSLLCRGRQLFRDSSDVSCSTDFASLVGAAISASKKNMLSKVLAGFLEDVFPAHARLATRLSSQMHGLVHLKTSGPARLKLETCHELFRLDPTFVASLPGHAGVPSGLRGRLLRRPTYSGELHRLLGRDALQQFDFVLGTR